MSGVGRLSQGVGVLLLLSLAQPALAQPALAQPCLSQEALAVIESRLGQLAAAAFLGSTGLGLCQPGLSADRQSTLQRINELSADAERNPEQIACASPGEGESSPHRTALLPEAAGHAAGATKACSCLKYKEALREAQAALSELTR